MKTFLLIAANEVDNTCTPSVQSNGIAEDIEEIIELWVDPTTGWVPDHIENICDDYDADVPDAVVKTEAIRMTRERFGIGCEKSEEYSNEYLIVEVDLPSGVITTYGS